MCGINLLFDRSNDTEMIASMNRKIGHRGIRSCERGYYNNQLQIGHVRLPIQGTDEQFDHPQESGVWHGYMVGEVFNFRDLDNQIVSDLHEIVDRWRLYGIRSFDEYDGFWSVVFVNRMTGAVFVITDPLGKKPLYIRTDEKAISSEIAPLVMIAPVTDDEMYYSTVAKFGYAMDGSTPFNEIRMMKPGMMYTFRLKGDRYQIHEGIAEATPYVDLSPLDPTDLRRDIEDAVRRRLISDYPIGILASGGLDSTIIYKLVERQTHNFSLVNIITGEDSDDPRYFTIHIDQNSDIPVHRIDVNIPTAQLEVFLSNQTPVDLGSVIPQFMIGRKLSEIGLHVALSGDGADELFGGYGRAARYDSQMSDIFHELVYYHLPRLDRLMMASTVELRCPFLSIPVVRKAMGISWIGNRQRKEFLKKMFSDIVPLGILARDKEPLKTKQIKDDPIRTRLETIEFFRDWVVPMMKGDA